MTGDKSVPVECVFIRHPEVLGAQRRASKGEGPGASAASFEGRFAAASG